MWEAIASWNVEVHAGSIIVALGALIGATLVGYSSGIVKGGDLVDERLAKLGIIAHETENLIEIHEAGDDKVVMDIKWDGEFVETTLYDVTDQSWQSDET